MNPPLLVVTLGAEAAARALSTADELAVERVGDADTAATFRERADCVVVEAAPGETIGDRVRAARDAFPGTPCIAVVAADEAGVAAVEAGATDAAPRDVPALLVRRVRNAAVRGSYRGRDDDGGAERKIRALHDVATRLEGAEDETAIFELAVEAAEDILAFDICYVGTVEDGEIRPQAANDDPLLADPVIMTVEEGLAGRTVRHGRTYVVDDAAVDPDADPVDDSYRSALSVPLGDVGVFQAVSTEYAAFDDTDRELAELLAAHVTAAVERVRYAATIRRERDRFAALFESVPDATARYVVEDGEPVVRSVNPAFERIFGYDAAGAVGRSLIDLVVPDGAREAARTNVDALQRGETITTEVERMTANGPREFLLRTAPVAEGDRATGYVIYTDVSDLKERERALQRQNARLQQFASIVSHDLRNPLNVATGRLAIAADDPKAASEHVRAAREALDRMARLIDDLLALARHGQVIDDPEPVAIGEAASAAWDAVATAEATLTVADPLSLSAHGGRLQQLFENLFRNAVEHCGPTVEVTVGALADAAGFYVEDDGPGIPPADRERVFDHGYTTGEGGTGLGLAIVEQVTDAHGWTVSVTDGDSGGARFEFRVDADSSPE